MRAIILKLLFDGKTRRLTWRKLSALLRHGISLRIALTMLRDRYLARKHPLGKLFSEVLMETEKGHFMDTAFSPWIPQEEMMLIRGGVQGGGLPEALRDCADLIEARTKIIHSLIASLAYPVFLLGLFFCLTFLIVFYVMPEMSQVSNPETWLGAAALLHKFSSFVASPLGLACFLLLLAFITLVLVTLPLWTGKTRLYVENIPPWSIYRLVVGSVWLFTMATLLRAGIQLDFILKDMLASGVMRPWLAERVRTIRDRYRSEGNFGSLLLHLNMNFPDAELVEELAIFATLPNFHINLYEIAKEWLDDGVTRISKQAKILNAVAMCAIIVLVCCFALAYGSLQQQLSSGLGGM